MASIAPLALTSSIIMATNFFRRFSSTKINLPSRFYQQMKAGLREIIQLRMREETCFEEQRT